MQSNRTLEEAKEAIASGELDKLKKLLEKTHEEEVEKEVWIPPSKRSSYGSRISDEDVYESRLVREDVKDIDLEKDGTALLIHAAKTRQLDMITFLLQRGVKITPAVMKSFLDELTTNIHPAILKAPIYGEPLNYELQSLKLHETINKITLLFFKEYLDYALLKNKDNLILTMLDKFEKYLLPGKEGRKEEIVKEFNEDAQNKIFYHGSVELIKETENIFNFIDYFRKHYAGDEPKKMQWNIAGTGMQNVEKLALLNSFRYDQADANTVRDNYQKAIELVVERLTQIHSAVKSKTESQLFPNRKQFETVDSSFKQVIEICIAQDLNEVEKVAKILQILHSTYKKLDEGSSILLQLKEVYDNTLKEINVSGGILMSPNTYLEIHTHMQLLERFPKSMEQELSKSSENIKEGPKQ